MGLTSPQCAFSVLFQACHQNENNLQKSWLHYKGWVLKKKGTESVWKENISLRLMQAKLLSSLNALWSTHIAHYLDLESLYKCNSIPQQEADYSCVMFRNSYQQVMAWNGKQTVINIYTICTTLSVSLVILINSQMVCRCELWVVIISFDKGWSSVSFVKRGDNRKH